MFYPVLEFEAQNVFNQILKLKKSIKKNVDLADVLVVARFGFGSSVRMAREFTSDLNR